MKWNAFRYHLVQTIKISYPIMLGHLGHVLVGVADSAMVGRVGTNSLAAAALANGLFNVLLTFGIGVSMGLSPLVAAASGRKDVEENKLWLKYGLWINAAVGIFIFLLVLITTPVLHIINQPKAVAALAVPYISILALSMLPLMIFQQYKQFAEGLKFTKMAMYISLFSNVINIFLNYILIFGMWGFPRMELEGAGWATLIARVIMALLMFLYIYKSAPFQQYWQKSIANFSWKPVKDMLKLGIPIGLQFMMEVAAFVFAAVMIGWLGARQLAAHQIAISLASITYMCASGVAAATTVRVGYYLGNKNIKKLRQAGIVSTFIISSFMLSCAVIFILANELLPAFFSYEPEVQRIAASLLIIAAIFQLSDGLQVTGLGILRGMKDVKIPTITTFCAYWVLGIPAGYIFAFVLGMGERGIWFGYVVGLSAAAVFLLARAQYLSKKLMRNI